MAYTLCYILYMYCFEWQYFVGPRQLQFLTLNRQDAPQQLSNKLTEQANLLLESTYKVPYQKKPFNGNFVFVKLLLYNIDLNLMLLVDIFSDEWLL